MKTLLLGVFPLSVLILAVGQMPAHAQSSTNAPSSAQSSEGREGRALSFLTPEQRIQYAKARKQALEENPPLKTEGEEMMKEAPSTFPDGTPEQKQAFLEKMNTHRQKLRQAMLKIDPTLQPVFAQIDEHLSEMKAKRMESMQDAPASPSTSSTDK